jgi:predicted RNA-binding Zn-ribbon protein involved in translation (DUF1610 family)
MDEPIPPVACPNCHATIPVDPEWRIVQCPRCGQMVTRMTDDASYD